MYEIPGWKMELQKRLEELRQRQRSQAEAKKSSKKSQKLQTTASAA